jgi:hypothetical protein
MFTANISTADEYRICGHLEKNMKPFKLPNPKVIPIIVANTNRRNR